MPLFTANRPATSRQLHQFGFASALLLPLLGWWCSLDNGWIAALAAVGGSLAAMAWLAPQWLAALFKGASLVTQPIGWLASELILLLIYLFVFIPIGVLLRLLGHDPLNRQIDRQCVSYWRAKPAPRSITSYYHQSQTVVDRSVDQA